jgi:hypothetical protein
LSYDAAHHAKGVFIKKQEVKYAKNNPVGFDRDHFKHSLCCSEAD